MVKLINDNGYKDHESGIYPNKMVILSDILDEVLEKDGDIYVEVDQIGYCPLHLIGCGR